MAFAFSCSRASASGNFWPERGEQRRDGRNMKFMRVHPRRASAQSGGTRVLPFANYCREGNCIGATVSPVSLLPSFFLSFDAMSRKAPIWGKAVKDQRQLRSLLRFSCSLFLQDNRRRAVNFAPISSLPPVFGPRDEIFTLNLSSSDGWLISYELYVLDYKRNSNLQFYMFYWF